MKKLLTAIIVLLCFAFTTKAQYVNIPDSNFRKFLVQKYPSCFNGVGQMDTTCNDILNEDSLICSFLSPQINSLEGIEYFKILKILYCNNNKLTTLPKLPDSLNLLNCSYNIIDSLPELPNSLTRIYCSGNKLRSLPILPVFLHSLNCDINNLDSLPILPTLLKSIDCSVNNLRILPALPDSLRDLICYNNRLLSLPKLPNTLIELICMNNQLANLPWLSDSLQLLYCSDNFIRCLPFLPRSLTVLNADLAFKISCIPNIPNYYCSYNGFPFGAVSIYVFCNPTNNSNQCQSFPVIKSVVFTDQNSNNKLDVSEFPRHNLKLTLSNNNYTYTNSQGIAYTNADSLSTYTITATPPPFYNAVPASYTHTFTTYDTIVYDTFALQPNILKDSIAIKLTPTNWAARPGFKYPYLVSYENVGTTVLNNANISLQYNNSLLTYDSSSSNTVVNNGNNLSINMGNLLLGQTGSFVAYFSVKPTTVLGSSVTSIASIATNTVAAYDTVVTIVRGSYDPNDKQATPSLTTQQVTEGRFIDYTIRFQNTGTDTAFTVVIADTLDTKLVANKVQIVGSSHNCKTTIKDNIIFFEFLDILLPDSNTNKLGSNGFVSFKIQPVSSVANGTTIPNKAAIYFDYNSPIITKPANTIIQNPLPVKLLTFSAIVQNANSSILVYWNTANEVNTSHFIIEQSLNGKDFEPAAEVAAKGSGGNNYYYSINKKNVVFTRLKMVDKNGQFTYSNIIKLASDQMSEFDIVNNPVKEYLYVKVYATLLENTPAKLVNAQGQIVKTVILKQGYQTINTSSLNSGVYYLQTKAGSRKIVVDK